MHIALLLLSYNFRVHISVKYRFRRTIKMYELIQNLIAFKYACKINHWSTDNYSKHLLFDRLTEDVDNWADSVAESYFMARNEKKVFKPDVLAPKMISRDLVKMCEQIISHIENLMENDDLDEGTKSLLGDIEAAFLGKIALAQLA